MESNLIFVPIGLAILGLVFMFIKMAWVKAQPSGDEKCKVLQRTSKKVQWLF